MSRLAYLLFIVEFDKPSEGGSDASCLRFDLFIGVVLRLNHVLKLVDNVPRCDNASILCISTLSLVLPVLFLDGGAMESTTLLKRLPNNNDSEQVCKLSALEYPSPAPSINLKYLSTF